MTAAGRRPCRLAVAGLVSLAWLTGAGSAQDAATDPIPDPVKLVRTLQSLQDDIAHGSVGSQSAQRELIGLIARRFLEADTEVWQDSRNSRAAVLYVLSGGSPLVLPALFEEDGSADQQLIRAAFAYASGRQSEAKLLWDAIDVTALPPALAGASALVKASLLMDLEPAKAMDLLDYARLVSPGSLVEEAAVRRGITTAAKLGDVAKLEFLAVSYARRFPRSLYAGAFRQQFAASYLSLPSAGEPASLETLRTILAALEPADRREIYLEIGRLSLVQANMVITGFVAAQAAALPATADAAGERAKLYRAAASAFADDDPTARAELEMIEPSRLSEADAELHKAVLQVVRTIEHWPQPGDGEEPPAEASSDPADASANSAASVTAALKARAETAMSEADRVMTQAAR